MSTVCRSWNQFLKRELESMKTRGSCLVGKELAGMGDKEKETAREGLEPVAVKEGDNEKEITNEKENGKILPTIPPRRKKTCR